MRLYFLRLHDGYSGGTGTARSDYQSLQKLWNGDIDRIGTIDNSETYSSEQLIGVMKEARQHWLLDSNAGAIIREDAQRSLAKVLAHRVWTDPGATPTCPRPWPENRTMSCCSAMAAIV